MMRDIRLGDDIDDFCVRCKRVMNHNVVSVLNGQAAKVRCRTCHTDHDFRHEQPPPPKIDARKAALFNEVLKKVAPGEAPGLVAGVARLRSAVTLLVPSAWPCGGGAALGRCWPGAADDVACSCIWARILSTAISTWPMPAKTARSTTAGASLMRSVTCGMGIS